jgi:predicted Zn-dependent protease
MPISPFTAAGVSTPVTMQVPAGFEAPVKMMRRLVVAAVMLCVLVAGSTSLRANMIRDAEIEAGLEALVQPLALAAGYGPGEITVRVVINPQYNAFVAGKRTIYVHSGLLLQAEDALEFLGVMAHEIGHIKAGHVPRLDEAQQQASGAAALATIAAMAIAAGGSGDAAAGVLIGGSDRANRVFLSSVRRNESVADEIGLALMDKAALSSVGLRNVMQRMARQRALPESRQSTYYSTHPASAERLQALQDHVNLSPHSANLPSSDVMQLYARMVSKLFAWTENPQRVLNKNGGLDASPDNRRYALAIASYRQGDLRSALGHIEYLLSAHPEDPFFHEFHGDILFALARPDAAAAALEAALTRRPASPLVQLTLGRALLATGDKANLPRAIEILQTAREGEPLWAFPARQHAIALGRAGHIAAADLALAEESILRGDKDRAVQLARRAMTHATVDTVTQSRASDIIFRYDGAAD